MPDRQSLNSFENVAPADLTESIETLAILARAGGEVPMDGAARDARQAIAQLPVADRPSALAVAGYFDRLAAGEGALRALPALGAFRDDAQGDRASSTRIRENLALARRPPLRRADAPCQFRRCPSPRGARSAPSAGHERHSQGWRRSGHGALQQGSDDLLVELAFDEAREILAPPAAGSISASSGKSLTTSSWPAATSIRMLATSRGSATSTKQMRLRRPTTAVRRRVSYWDSTTPRTATSSRTRRARSSSGC